MRVGGGLAYDRLFVTVTDMMVQEPPIIIEPTQTSSTPATLIFLHGFSDDANGWTNLAHQLRSASKLPNLKWIFPNAPYDQESMANAWYSPRSFSPIPVPKRVAEEEDDDCEDDKEGIMKSVEYVSGLVEEEAKAGTPLDRIIVGGFSQGCAISLLLGLFSRWKGRLGGIVTLSGYLPLSRGVENKLKSEKGSEWGSTKWFLAHGSRDQLVPLRYFKDYKEKLDSWTGVENVEAHIYEGMPHTTAGPEIRDLCAWLERVLVSKT